MMMNNSQLSRMEFLDSVEYHERLNLRQSCL